MTRPLPALLALGAGALAACTSTTAPPPGAHLNEPSAVAVFRGVTTKSGHQPPDQAASSPGVGSEGRDSNTSYQAVIAAIARNGGCIADADHMHVHGDTHAIVRKDDMLNLIGMVNTGSKVELELHITRAGLDGVRAHLDDCERKGIPPSARILRGLLKVFSHQRPEEEDT